MTGFNPDYCLHCAIAKLREEQFPELSSEASINAMLELITDFISGEPLEEQMRLFELTERIMMQNRNDVLHGRYKPDRAPTGARVS